MRFIGLACFVSLATFTQADLAWMRVRLYLLDHVHAQRLADSCLTLHSCDIGPETDVIVGPDDWPELLLLGIPYRIISKIPPPDQPYIGGPFDDWTNEFLRYDQIIAQYEQWRAAAPTMITRTQIGTSWGNRPVYAYKIVTTTRRPPGLPPRKQVVLIGACHAREWISPPTVMYIFDKLRSPLSLSTAHKRLLDKFEFHIIPVMNPDGYEFTWTNNRYWRKNRRNNGDGTFGVDLNRNYAKAWGGQGSSGNTSSETYRGPAPFSEPEAQAVRDYCNSLNRLVFAIDFHSYGYKILWPWSYTTAPPAHATWFNSLGQAYRDGILSSGGATYQQGQASVILYIAAGTSKDWFYDVFTAASFTLELRGTDFVISPSQIIPTGAENWAGFIATLALLE